MVYITLCSGHTSTTQSCQISWDMITVGIPRPHSQARFPGIWSRWAYFDHTVKPDFLGYDHSGHTSTTHSSQISWDMITVGIPQPHSQARFPGTWSQCTYFDHTVKPDLFPGTWSQWAYLNHTVKPDFLRHDHSGSYLDHTVKPDFLGHDHSGSYYFNNSQVKFPGIWSQCAYLDHTVKPDFLRHDHSGSYLDYKVKSSFPGHAHSGISPSQPCQISWDMIFHKLLHTTIEANSGFLKIFIYHHDHEPHGMFHSPIMDQWNVPFTYHVPHGMFHPPIMDHMECSIPLSWTTWNVPFLYHEQHWIFHSSMWNYSHSHDHDSWQITINNHDLYNSQSSANYHDQIMNYC